MLICGLLLDVFVNKYVSGLHNKKPKKQSKIQDYTNFKTQCYSVLLKVPLMWSFKKVISVNFSLSVHFDGKRD